MSIAKLIVNMHKGKIDLKTNQEDCVLIEIELNMENNIYDEEKNIIKNKFAPNLSATFLNTYPIYDNLLINSYLENEDIIK